MLRVAFCEARGATVGVQCNGPVRSSFNILSKVLVRRWVEFSEDMRGGVWIFHAASTLDMVIDGTQYCEGTDQNPRA